MLASMPNPHLCVSLLCIFFIFTLHLLVFISLLILPHRKRQLKHSPLRVAFFQFNGTVLGLHDVAA